jgi:GrpB-like predicted nucleotidyltransferase (UPF0157 family)
VAAVAIEIRDYDTRWPMLADEACRELSAALPGAFAAIEHIGSTAVPGLTAKPIIDLMAATPALSIVVDREPALDALGYQRHETGMPNRLFYLRDGNGRHRHHLHVVPADSWPGRNERLLRDYLRHHPDDAARYAALKRQLQRAVPDADAYTRAKTDLIQELTDRARAEHGLPLVPVWEE